MGGILLCVGEITLGVGFDTRNGLVCLYFSPNLPILRGFGPIFGCFAPYFGDFNTKGAHFKFLFGEI